MNHNHTSRSLLSHTAPSPWRVQLSCKLLNRFCVASSFLAVSLSIITPIVKAQVTSDRTVSTTVTTPDGRNFTITDGIRARDNLFHSFQEFSIPTNGFAFFDNPVDVQNIISRVTGGKLSNIDGLIRANGSANLFLINPSGIIFGPNARLNLGGSFLASTAESLLFNDDSIFSAKNSTANPVLSVNVPIGLQYGVNPGAIRVQGTGHNLVRADIIFSPLLGSSNSGLRVESGKTLALVGGDLDLAGGILTAAGGRIELGSVGTPAKVNLNSIASGWSLSYQEVQHFGNINMVQTSLVDVSGLGGGAIQIFGREISLANDSLVLSRNAGVEADGNISVNASETIALFLSGNLTSQTLASGRGADIIASAPQVLLQQGGGIGSENFGTGVGGNITIAASKEIQLLDSFPTDPTIISNVRATAYSSGNAGNITVFAGQLRVLNGSAVTSTVFGSGIGGAVTVNAKESIELMGAASFISSPSTISSGTVGAGNAGSVTLNTARLMLRDGADVSSSAYSTGNGGSVTVNASQSVDIRGSVPEIGFPSQIISSVQTLNPELQQLLQLPSVPSGRSGTIAINTPQLIVGEGGRIAVGNQGQGDAGTIAIDANKIFLNRDGGITAATQSGEGGNIFLQANSLQIQDNSAISATAAVNGNGGNLNIKTDTLTQLENSDITANAFEGKGGNIQISTQGIFLSPDSDITASSQLGVSGNVNISVLNLNTQNFVVALSNTFVGEAPVVASSCLTRRNAERGSFVVTGNGGLPETPDRDLIPYEAVQVRATGQLPARGNGRSQIATTDGGRSSDAIVEATGFAFTADGKLALVVAKSQPAAVEDLTCSVN